MLFIYTIKHVVFFTSFGIWTMSLLLIQFHHHLLQGVGAYGSVLAQHYSSLVFQCFAIRLHYNWMPLLKPITVHFFDMLLPIPPIPLWTTLYFYVVNSGTFFNRAQELPFRWLDTRDTFLINNQDSLPCSNTGTIIIIFLVFNWFFKHLF